ncbi:MAG: phosphoglucosamine mutase [Lachnospiraceae bacterium]|nr:phosphoglucosamine mutase [Lachnospiraceae bacterium]
MGKYFGTDGFRGEANVNLTSTHAYRIGRYLGYYFSKNRPARIVIGKDTRLSGYMFEYALVAGLMASGAKTYLLHVAPTPCVSYNVKEEQFDCGIMISASHNPYYDNGIKIIDADGHKIPAQLEEEIEQYIDAPNDDLPLVTKNAIGKTIDFSIGRAHYLRHLQSLPSHSWEGLRVGIDCANGAASSLAKPLFTQMGAQVYVIHNKPNGTNINKNCGSTHTESLQTFVKDNGLDIGFAYDGDADRCFAVDNTGRLVNGDLIMYLCASYFHRQGCLNKNTVVSTLISNIGLRLALNAQGIELVQTDVGDKYVSECMVKNGYNLGGEQTGHIILGDYAQTGDGLLTSLMLMEILASEKSSLSDLLEGIQIFPQLNVNVPVTDKQLAYEDEDLQKTVSAITKELGAEGRVIVRQSGTEPLLRLMVEGKNDTICQTHIDHLMAVLTAKGYVY